MNELVQHNGGAELSEQVRYAELISNAGMLPTAYRGKPADILLAVGLGSSMGLSPAESLMRIHVIQGRPTASAELIAANVRKAGHTLRVQGDETGARATIRRADDPDFEYESTWTLDRAKKMGLTDKDQWKKQPGTMMRWRAITEVARLACSEALYGVTYVTEEIDDSPRQPSRPSGPTPQFTQQHPTPEPTDVSDAEVVEDEPGITPQQSKALHASFNDAGITEREQRLAYCQHLTGRDIASSSDLTKAEASDVIDALKADAEAADTEQPEPDDGFMVQQEAGQ